MSVLIFCTQQMKWFLTILISYDIVNLGTIFRKLRFVFISYDLNHITVNPNTFKYS